MFKVIVAFEYGNVNSEVIVAAANADAAGYAAVAYAENNIDPDVAGVVAVIAL